MRMTGLTLLFDTVIAESEPISLTKIFHLGFGSTLLLLHDISSSAEIGGRCEVEFCRDASGEQSWPANSEELPVDNVAEGYSASIAPCTEYMKVTLYVSDGIHSVWVEGHEI